MKGPTEDAIHIALIRWLAYQHPAIAPRVHHSPNGGWRTKATAGRLKAQGVRPGFPDLILPQRRGGFSGLAIELKSATGRPTPEQLDWLDWLAAQGWQAVVCKGFDAAKDTLAAYIALEAG